MALCFLDKPDEQHPPYPLSARRGSDIDAHLGDARVHLASRDGTESSPSEGVLAALSDKSSEAQMSVVPRIPSRRFGFKGGDSGGDAFGIDCLNVRPIGRVHFLYDQIHGSILSRSSVESVVNEKDLSD